MIIDDITLHLQLEEFLMKKGLRDVFKKNVIISIKSGWTKKCDIEVIEEGGAMAIGNAFDYDKATYPKEEKERSGFWLEISQEWEKMVSDDND